MSNLSKFFLVFLFWSLDARQYSERDILPRRSRDKAKDKTSIIDESAFGINQAGWATEVMGKK